MPPKAPPGATSPKRAAGGAPVANYKARIERIMQHYDPSKVDTVGPMMEKFKGQEGELLKALVKRYGPEPGTPAAARPAAKSVAPGKKSASPPGRPPAKSTPPAKAPPPGAVKSAPGKASPIGGKKTPGPVAKAPPSKSPAPGSVKSAPGAAASPPGKAKAPPGKSASPTGKMPPGKLPPGAAGSPTGKKAPPGGTAAAPPGKKMPPAGTKSAPGAASSSPLGGKKMPPAGTKSAPGAASTKSAPAAGGLKSAGKKLPPGSTAAASPPAATGPASPSKKRPKVPPEADEGFPSVRQLLMSFYETRAPEKLENLDEILSAFVGKYDKMFKSMEERYGAVGEVEATRQRMLAEKAAEEAAEAGEEEQVEEPTEEQGDVDPQRDEAAAEGEEGAAGEAADENEASAAEVSKGTASGSKLSTPLVPDAPGPIAAPRPSPLDATPRELLTRFYRKNAPEKLESLDETLKKFEDREETMFASIEESHEKRGAFDEIRADIAAERLVSEKRQVEVRTKLTEMLQKRQPGNVELLDRAMADFAGREDVLLTAFERKYTALEAADAEEKARKEAGPESLPPVPTDRLVLEAFYHRYAPEKAQNIDDIMAKFSGPFSELTVSLEDRYRCPGAMAGVWTELEQERSAALAKHASDGSNVLLGLVGPDGQPVDDAARLEAAEAAAAAEEESEEEEESDEEPLLAPPQPAAAAPAPQPPREPIKLAAPTPKALMTAYYSKHVPTKVGSVDTILTNKQDIVQRNPQDLYDQIEAKNGTNGEFRRLKMVLLNEFAEQALTSRGEPLPPQPSTKEVLDAFFARHAPEMVAGSQDLLNKHGDRIGELYSAMEQRYRDPGGIDRTRTEIQAKRFAEAVTKANAAPPPPNPEVLPPPAAEGVPPQQKKKKGRFTTIEKVRLLCEKFAPDKLPLAEKVVEHYAGREDELFTNLHTQYGIQSEDEYLPPKEKKKKKLAADDGTDVAVEGYIRRRVLSDPEATCPRAAQLARHYGISPHYVPFLMKIHANNERAVLFDLLCTLFPEGTDNILANDEQKTALSAKRLAEFYAYHNPRFVPEVPNMLAKYEGKSSSAPMGDALLRYYGDVFKKAKAPQYTWETVKAAAAAPPLPGSPLANPVTNPQNPADLTSMTPAAAAGSKSTEEKKPDAAMELRKAIDTYARDIVRGRVVPKTVQYLDGELRLRYDRTESTTGTSDEVSYAEIAVETNHRELLMEALERQINVGTMTDAYRLGPSYRDQARETKMAKTMAELQKERHLDMYGSAPTNREAGATAGRARVSESAPGESSAFLEVDDTLDTENESGASPSSPPAWQDPLNPPSCSRCKELSHNLDIVTAKLHAMRVQNERRERQRLFDDLTGLSAANNRDCRECTELRHQVNILTKKIHTLRTMRQDVQKSQAQYVDLINLSSQYPMHPEDFKNLPTVPLQDQGTMSDLRMQQLDGQEAEAILSEL